MKLLPLFLLLMACTPTAQSPELTAGRPVMLEIGAPSASKIERLEITARLPSIAAWTIRLEKDAAGIWRMTSRSDRPGSGSDLADAKLIEHFLDILGSFTTESDGGNGNDAGFGLNPYRFEARVSAGGITKTLQLGDLVGTTGIYFRVGEKTGKTWVGRGALIPFLPSVDTPEGFVSKSPYVLAATDVRTFTLEKLQDPGRGRWSFTRDGGLWMNGQETLSAEASARIERIIRQRVDHLSVETPDFAHPDWKLTVQNGSEEESLTLLYVLNDVFGRNPKRSDRALTLYPEFAGALRAFTQARFTPDKSGTK